MIVIINSRYTSLHPTSIYNKNSSKDFFYFLDLNEATREVIASVRNSKELTQVVKSKLTRQLKNLKEEI